MDDKFKCANCKEGAVIKVGKDEVPLCEEHFELFCKGFSKVIENIKKVIGEE